MTTTNVLVFVKKENSYPSLGFSATFVDTSAPGEPSKQEAAVQAEAEAKKDAAAVQGDSTGGGTRDHRRRWPQCCLPVPEALHCHHR